MHLDLQRANSSLQFSSGQALGAEPFLKRLADVVKEVSRGDVVLPLHLLSVNGQGQILGHNALLVNSVDASLLELLGEGDESVVSVELAAEGKTTSPGVDGGNRVGAGLLALLVLSEMAGNGLPREMCVSLC